MIVTRPAKRDDYEFLFNLKKAAEFEAINSVFGWNEKIQREIHSQEWEKNKPIIIEVNGISVGSYLINQTIEFLYFERFFLLPEYQGQGIGTNILKDLVRLSDKYNLSIKLCYLQGNKVATLYKRFNFKVTSEDAHFVYMIKYCKLKNYLNLE